MSNGTPGLPSVRARATIKDVRSHRYEFFYGYRRSVPAEHSVAG